VNVVPIEFDPFRTDLVQTEWLTGTGCPTKATTFIDDPATPTFDPTRGTFTDLACPTGDPKDSPGRNEGLLLVKTGPTGNFAAAEPELRGVKGITLTELGYDIRKKGANNESPLGSHCGAGAPRFNVVTSDGVTHFVGCNSTATPPSSQTPGDGWLRLRWNPAALALAGILAGNTVKAIDITFDEGQDASGGPDSFGLAVIDNIDINGVLIGRGPAGGN
jgi:hypothetical protein